MYQHLWPITSLAPFLTFPLLLVYLPFSVHVSLLLSLLKAIFQLLFSYVHNPNVSLFEPCLVVVCVWAVSFFCLDTGM